MTDQVQDQYYKCHIFCCTNQRPDGHKRGCCASKNALKLRNYMKAAVKEKKIPASRVNAAGCLDRCEEGPVLVIYPEGVWYKYETTQDVDRIISEHLENGRIVEDLKLPDVKE